MSKWDDARALYLNRLEGLDGALDKLAKVTQLEPSLLERSKREELKTLKDGIVRQLEKLRKNEFHIAVVGLEKAGKSTFLSAWMRAEILPNQDKRCTYTTTEIRSVPSSDDQRIEVDFLTRPELDDLKRQYEQTERGGGREGEMAGEDLHELELYSESISRLLGQDKEVYEFSDSAEVMQILDRFVADPSNARAVRDVKVFTSSLSDQSGIVFHDVPGYDSPITLHKEQARSELARADIVLFLTNISDTVSLRKSQLEMLDSVRDREDDSIKVKDKTFFFLNKADKSDSSNDLKRRIESSREELVGKYKLCEPERIIVGSAAAHLMKSPVFITEATRDMLGNVIAKLDMLDPPHGDGMGRLRELVEHYLANDRAEVLDKRCKSFLRKGEALIKQVRQTADERFPESLDEFDHGSASRERERAVDLFDDRWREFEVAFDAYWQQSIQPLEDLEQIGVGIHPSLVNLHERYKEAIDQLDDLLGEDALEAIFRASREREPRPSYSNMASRKEIMSKSVEVAAERLTATISMEVCSITSEVVEWVSQRFNDMPGVREAVVPSGDISNYEVRLKHGFNGLLLRFARPAADIFLSTARGTQDRCNVRESRRTDIYLLDLFHGGDIESRGSLDAFLHSGKWIPLSELRSAAEFAGDVVEEVVSNLPATRVPAGIAKKGGAGILDKYITSTAQKSKNVPSSPTPTSILGGGLSRLVQHATEATQASTLEDVSLEIKEDINAFLDYLKNAVYFAASFEEVVTQELSLVRRHIKSEDTRKKVRRVYLRAFDSNDPSVAGDAASGRGNFEHKRRVLGALDELRARHDSMSRDAISTLKEAR